MYYWIAYYFRLIVIGGIIAFFGLLFLGAVVDTFIMDIDPIINNYIGYK